MIIFSMWLVFRTWRTIPAVSLIPRVNRELGPDSHHRLSSIGALESEYGDIEDNHTCFCVWGSHIAIMATFSRTDIFLASNIKPALATWKLIYYSAQLLKQSMDKPSMKWASCRPIIYYRRYIIMHIVYVLKYSNMRTVRRIPDSEIRRDWTERGGSSMNFQSITET